MKNNKIPLIVLLAFVILLIGTYVLYDKLAPQVESNQLATQESMPEEPQGKTTQPAAETEPPQTPDFTVYDIDGNPVQLSDYFGRPIVLNFWASWCGPCQSEMPDFQEKYLELGEDIHFLMVNMTDGSRETVEIAAHFIADKGYTFPVFYDTASEAAYFYSVYSLPTTYFIDADGNAVAQAAGAINAATLQQGIDMITE